MSGDTLAFWFRPMSNFRDMPAVVKGLEIWTRKELSCRRWGDGIRVGAAKFEVGQGGTIVLASHVTELACRSNNYYAQIRT
jgi:hypothetical protein